MKSCMGLIPGKELQDKIPQKLFNIVSYILFSTLNRKNKDYKKYFDIQKMITKMKIIGEDMLMLLKDLEKSVKDISNLPELIKKFANILARISKDDLDFFNVTDMTVKIPNFEVKSTVTKMLNEIGGFGEEYQLAKEGIWINSDFMNDNVYAIFKEDFGYIIND